MILGYPFSDGDFWVQNELIFLGSPLDVIAKKCGIFEVKRRFALGELQLLSKLENPTADQPQSVAGPLQWAPQMCPRLRPFLAGLCAFFENRMGFAKNWQKIVDYELKIWELFLKSPRLLPPRTFLRDRLKIDIYTEACDRPPFEKASVNWKSGIGIGWILVINDRIVEFFSLEVGEKSIRGNRG